ncbi:protein kinase [Trypanosoma theileri]|uniref:Protein kinase n=1 Tax=Trypanosoma theileri TaxID=67003 RepID=A0A1X0NT03_9TRYP|nr:protein kinase [Trypanosoma theileri]ORC87834.1 protein kinase [Trypanosoma theileri]
MGCGVSRSALPSNSVVSFNEGGENAPHPQFPANLPTFTRTRLSVGNGYKGKRTSRTCGDADGEEEMLSDITVGASQPSLGNDSPAAPHMLFHSENIVSEQKALAPTIEEDLFVYDDAVVSKDEAQAKHWRIEGRKPPAAMGRRPTDPRHSAVGMALFTAAGTPATTTWDDGKGSASLFRFTDFNVHVDEVEFSRDGASFESAERRASMQESLSRRSAGSAKVTRTFSAMPNTAAALVKSAEASSSNTSNRPIRHFKVNTLIGHAARVKCLAVAPNERSIVSCACTDASVTMRALSNGNEEGIFTGHHDTVICTAISPDGKFLATTSKDHTLTLWDATVTKLLCVIEHDKVVICCCFSPDSKTVVSGCQDRICRLWDTRNARERLAYTHHGGIIVSVAYSPDGKYVCSASADKTLRVWSTTTGKTRWTLEGHVGIVLACSYTSNGTHIVSNDEKCLCVWSTEDGSRKLRLSVADVIGVTRQSGRMVKLGWTLSCAAPGPFTGYIVAACTNRFVYIIDIETGKEYASTFCKAPVYCMASGLTSKVVLGDSFGNIYAMTLM